MLDAAIPDADYFDDVHGAAHYKRHLTYYFAEQIRAELGQGAEAMNYSINGRTISVEPTTWPVPENVLA